jgi:hypothetical protein
MNLFFYLIFIIIFKKNKRRKKYRYNRIYTQQAAMILSTISEHKQIIHNI